MSLKQRWIRSRTPAILAVALGGGLLALVGNATRGAGDGKASPAPARADTAEPLTELKVVARVTAATDKALDYLERVQVKAGPTAGSWHTNNAMNALAMLAFMGRGHVPGRGKYGDVIEGGVVKPGVLTRGRKYVLSTMRADGYFGAGGGQMYEHGLTTLALAEMYGMDSDPELEAKLRKAVDLILRSQGKIGGWNYQPSPTDGDLSVSVMQIVALRAARNAALPVPDEAIKKAINYVMQKANPGGGGFGYNGPGAGPQTSAAGALSLQLLGPPDDPKLAKKINEQIGKTLDYLAPTKVAWVGSGANYFYYFHYYAVQAFYQAGGKHWNNWHPQIREVLLEKQNPDGSWDVPPGTAEAGLITPTNKVYSTAMATMVLDIYMHYLPAYQR